MHVLLIHQAFASLDEAGGTRHHELARYLAGQGHRVTVIASPVSYLSGATRSGHRPRWVERQQDGENITILRTYTYSALHRSFFHRLLSFFSFMFSSFWVGVNVPKVDLVWGTSPPIFQGVTAWAVARLKRVPFLFEVRDLWPAFAVAVGVLHQPLLIRASEWLERFLYRHADRVMVNSPGYVEHVRDRGARRVELIPNGADPAMFDPQADGADFRHRNGLDGKVVAMYAGAHGMSNDLGVVLGAARELKDCPDLALVLLGDGKDKPALMAQAQSESLENVIFLPPAPKTEMGEALAAADLCIAILKPLAMYATTYPNKVFDYMAAGRPVVLAIDGVIRKVVEEAGAGVFVPPGNAHALAQALRLLANDPQARHRMGANGRSAIETQFSRADLAQRLTELLEEMERNRG
jgi:glycosyltransferase involved in cell wall biosynthesis